LRLSSFGGYELALAALALVVFGAYDSYPEKTRFCGMRIYHIIRDLGEIKLPLKKSNYF